MKKYYTPKEFSDLIGVNLRTVLRWIKEKKLFAMNTGSEKKPKYRIRDTDIMRFEAECYGMDEE